MFSDPLFILLIIAFILTLLLPILFYLAISSRD